MTNRTALALAACDGLTDQDLADRGPQGFKKMIERKRKYAAAARLLTVANAQLAAHLKAAQTKLAELEQKVATFEAIEKLEAPINDTAQAAELLAGIGKLGGAA